MSPLSRRSQQLRVWLILALAALLLALGGASFARRAVAFRPLLGIEWLQASAGPLAIAVAPESAAWRAGVRDGDLLLEVNGVPVASALDASQIGWGRQEQQPEALLVRRGQSELTILVTPDRHPMSEIYLYLTIVGLAFWVSGTFIALRWPGVRGGTLYSLLALCLFAHLALSHTGRADTLDWVIHWGDLISGALAPALLVHLAVSLSKLKFRHRRTLVGTCYGFSSLMMLAGLWVSPAAGGGAYRFDSPLLAVQIRDRIEPLFLAAALAVAVILLVKAYNKSSSVLQRGQMRWLLWGLGLGLGPSMIQLVPWALGAPPLPSWAAFAAVAPMLFVPAALTAALARYRLHDLDLLLLRGLTEVGAIFCTFAVYSAAAFLLREGVSELFPLSRSATRYIGFLIAAISYPQLRNWVRTGVEKAFYRKRYSYRITLLDWARELNAETDLSSLIGRLRERIRATLGVRSAEVLLQTGERCFEAIDTDEIRAPVELSAGAIASLGEEAYIQVERDELPAVPWARYLFSLRVKGRLRAVLAIAEREHPQEPLTTEDRALLGTLAAHAATAIEAARLVLEVRQRADEVELLHARQEQILEGSAVGLLLLDERGKILAWNRALEGIYGLSREEAIGGPLGDVFPLQVVQRIRRQDQAGDSRIFRLGMVNRQGQRIVVNMSLSPVDDGGVEGGGRVLTFDDVTERVKLEEQVLRQERLASLGLLAAGVAHEINTPLTGISSYTQLLLEECPDDDLRRPLLEKIETQTRRASNITGSLLNLARPENTTLMMLDLNEPVQEVLQLFEPQIRGSRVKLRAKLQDGLPDVRGHKGKLQQVLLNLLINARDAVSEGGEIQLSTSSRDGKVIVEVTDDGGGIAEEDLPRIFDPFFTTKGRGRGTGLGLSISYGIIREHDGQIQVESSPSRFTRFRVELPAA